MAGRRRTWTTAAVLVASGLGFAACASTDQGVTATRADAGPATETTPGTDVAATEIPATTMPATTMPATEVPLTEVPLTEVPAAEVPATPPLNTDPDNPLDPPGDSTPALPGGGRIDFGDAKTARDYDNFMNAALADIDAFFADVVPDIYGVPFVPVTTVYAAYPERADLPIVCGEPSSFDEVEQNAFYGLCFDADGKVTTQNDSIVYDDGILMPDLVARFGTAASGASVLAHEYGHAISARGGVFDLDLPTVDTEQQADCFSGAWAAHIARGESPGFEFTDADIKAFIVATIEIGDSVGRDVLSPGAHGTAFDRVGAVEEGFLYGAQRCADFVTTPYPRVDLIFSEAEFETAGNLAYDEILTEVPASLDTYWVPTLEAVAVPFTSPTLATFPGDGPYPDCDGLPGEQLANRATFCSSSNTIVFDGTFGQDLYTRVGDLAVGYPIAAAYGDAVQAALGMGLAGERRALLDDCLTGAWLIDIIPAPGSDPEAATPTNAAQAIVLSAGDLDEVVQVAVILGDEATNDNVIGTAFEKVDAFRHGVLGGMDVCQGLLG